MPGLILAAPNSGAGKTTVTLGLLRALRDRGVSLKPAKSGPDYIDPRFHAAASGQTCTNLDAWAMSPERIRARAATSATLVIEGAMGLFDGAADGTARGAGATADLARLLRLPVVLVIDCARMGQSVAALARGYATFDPDVRIAGLILNNTGSDRHRRLLTTALAALGIPVLGCLPRDPGLALPSRHLGLVQAEEHPDLEAFLTHAASAISGHIDLDALLRIADGAPAFEPGRSPPQRPPAQSIAIALDAAFAFVYPHHLADWHASGATLSLFSPLNDDPAPEADLIYLPGGYPELHAPRLAANQRFLNSLRETKAHIFGECGGYMVLGEVLTDAEGAHHEMAGLLPLHTSFERRKLHLGYRTLAASAGPFAGQWKGHEFHYASTLRAEGTPLLEAKDAEGTPLPPMGLIRGNVSGSFAHLIDRA